MQVHVRSCSRRDDAMHSLLLGVTAVLVVLAHRADLEHRALHRNPQVLAVPGKQRKMTTCLCHSKPVCNRFMVFLAIPRYSVLILFHWKQKQRSIIQSFSRYSSLADMLVRCVVSNKCMNQCEYTAWKCFAHLDCNTQREHGPAAHLLSDHIVPLLWTFHAPLLYWVYYWVTRRPSHEPSDQRVGSTQHQDEMIWHMIIYQVYILYVHQWWCDVQAFLCSLEVLGPPESQEVPVVTNIKNNAVTWQHRSLLQ